MSETEEKAAKELEAVSVMISRPGEGHPQSDLFNSWGVCVGSHGGHAKTLKAAMRRCLRCCDIGDFWRVNHGQGEMLEVVFERVAAEHLGGLNTRATPTRR